LVQRSEASVEKSKAEDDIIKVEFDLLEPLRDAPKWGVVTEIIESAAPYGGFLAGGFASQLARIALAPNRPRRAHLKDLESTYIDVEKAFGPSDIDMFFDDNESLECFVYTKPFTRPNKINIVESSGGEAYEFKVKVGNDRNSPLYVRFQLIKRWLGTPKHVVGDFDLVNAMVGYRRLKNTHTTFVHKDWKRYEDARQVHVLNWNSPMVIKRVVKYVKRKGYSGLSQETADQLSAASMEFINGIRSGKYSFEFCPTESSFASNLSTLMPYLSIDQLLTLSMINVKFDEYERDKTFHERVMRTIVDRHARELEERHAAAISV